MSIEFKRTDPSLRCPKKLRDALASNPCFFDRCGTRTLPSSATGSGQYSVWCWCCLDVHFQIKASPDVRYSRLVKRYRLADTPYLSSLKRLALSAPGGASEYVNQGSANKSLLAVPEKASGCYRICSLLFRPLRYSHVAFICHRQRQRTSPNELRSSVS